MPRIRTEVVRGCFKCCKARCEICNFMSDGNSFKSNVSGREYDMHSNIVMAAQFQIDEGLKLPHDIAVYFTDLIVVN